MKNTFKLSANLTQICLALTFSLIGQLLFIQSSYAQRVQPMVFELEPIGVNSSESLRIDNVQQFPITLEFIPSKLTLDEYGQETRTPADDDFLIYPPQTIIEAGKTQVVRVKYIGDPAIETSQAYRVSVMQLPVDLKEAGTSGVGLVMNFHTLVNVAPEKTKAELSVVEIKHAENNKWEITIKNTGNRFARLSKTSWEVSSLDDPSKNLRIKSLEVGALTDKNLVVPHSQLKLSIPAIEGFTPDSTKINIMQN